MAGPPGDLGLVSSVPTPRQSQRICLAPASALSLQPPWFLTARVSWPLLCCEPYSRASVSPCSTPAWQVGPCPLPLGGDRAGQRAEHTCKCCCRDGKGWLPSLWLCQGFQTLCSPSGPPRSHSSAGVSYPHLGCNWDVLRVAVKALGGAPWHHCCNWWEGCGVWDPQAQCRDGTVR